MKYLSLFSGIEAASVAWQPLGWEPLAFAEIEPFPAAVLAERYPETPNLGNVNGFKSWPDMAADLIVGGSPCFPRGTLILTEAGYAPIETIKPGTKVLTHMGRWKRVVKTGQNFSRLVSLRGQGCPQLLATPNHPILSGQRKGRSTHVHGKPTRLSWVDGPSWHSAIGMKGRHWALAGGAVQLPAPPVETRGRETIRAKLGPDLMWLAGAYVGDGWPRTNERRGSVIYGVNPTKAKQITERIARLGLTATITTERTTTRIAMHGRAIARWMIENFGHKAHKKTLPGWIYGAPSELKEAFLSGWHAMDGTKNENQVTTTSKRLRVGLVTLLVGMNKVPSVTEIEPSTWHIEGRSGVSRRYWNIRWKDRPETRTAFRRGWLLFGRVRKVKQAGMGLVFNIEVEGDNSYVADGIVVHNCQSFSVAGLRRGLDDPRGRLALTYLAIVDRYRPRWLVWENVPGVLSADEGRAFGAFIGALAELRYGFAWRVLDAQYTRSPGFCGAVPQRRRRLFLVGHIGAAWQRAASVLFDAPGMCWNPPPRREAGQGITHDVAGCIVSGGRGIGRTGESRGQDPVVAVPGVANTITASADRDASSLPDNGQTAIVEVANPLTARMHKGINTTLDEGQTPIVVNARQDPISGDIPGALDKDGGTHAIAFDMRGRDGGSHLEGPHDTANIRAVSGCSSRSYVCCNAVRRLTPLECERLQGFPDNWTRIQWRGKPASKCPDGPRYSALGNSMAVNVMR